MEKQTNLIVTPTLNSIPIRHGDFSTMVEALAYAAQGEAGFNFFNVFGELTDVLSYQTLQQKAQQLAVVLKDSGFKKGMLVGMIAETSAAFLVQFFACQYLGVLVAPLATPSSAAEIETYGQKLSVALASAKITTLFCSERYQAFIQAPLKQAGIAAVSFEQWQNVSITVEDALFSKLTPFTADEPAYIQFSSGSTTQPKGVLLTQKNIHANLRVVLKEGMQLKHEDRSFSWLPFYHNMGLIGFMLGSVYAQRSVDCLSAEHFVQNPLIWLELMTRLKTNIISSPLFGYQLAMKHYLGTTTKPELDLSSIRVAGIGGDMIASSSLKEFARCFEGSGFSYNVFTPSYGMTETTLAISIADTDKEPFTDILKDSIPPKEVISCGKPLPSFSVKIRDADTKEELPEREVGQIWVSGASVIEQYLNPNTELIKDNNGYIFTGDLGYFYQGHLFISGREKDLIIIRGKNLWAQDIEWLAHQAEPEIGNNRIAAMGIFERDKEKLVILIQVSPEASTDFEQIKKKIRTAVSHATGVLPEINFTQMPLLLTASGKLARSKTKEAFLNQQIELI